MNVEQEDRALRRVHFLGRIISRRDAHLNQAYILYFELFYVAVSNVLLQPTYDSRLTCWLHAGSTCFGKRQTDRPLVRNASTVSVSGTDQRNPSQQERSLEHTHKIAVMMFLIVRVGV